MTHRAFMLLQRLAARNRTHSIAQFQKVDIPQFCSHIDTGDICAPVAGLKHAF